MKILLVTFSAILPFVLKNFLNPENEYRAIVVDDVEAAKDFFAKENLPKEFIFPFSELKYCLDKNDFDHLVAVSNIKVNDLLMNQILQFNFSKIPINFTDVVHTSNFALDIKLNFFKKNSDKVEMFATGISDSDSALDAEKFNYSVLKFTNASLQMQVKIYIMIIKLQNLFSTIQIDKKFTML